MSQIEKVLYTARAHTTGGRDGASRSSDGRLDVKLSSPGTAGTGTNPEQLFAAGWSACFMSAMTLAASQKKVSLPPDRAIDAEVDLGTDVVIKLVETSSDRNVCTMRRRGPPRRRDWHFNFEVRHEY